MIVGGCGNDSTHGGGNDIFCFGENWGEDTIELLSDGSISLWFKSGSESNWEASTLTYADRSNRIKVSGISAENITLLFGNADALLYDELTAAGCFDDAFGTKILENEDNGMLA